MDDLVNQQVKDLSDLELIVYLTGSIKAFQGSFRKNLSLHVLERDLSLHVWLQTIKRGLPDHYIKFGNLHL